MGCGNGAGSSVTDLGLRAGDADRLDIRVECAGPAQGRVSGDPTIANATGEALD